MWLNAAEMSNMTDLWLSGAFFQALNTPKTPFWWGSLRRSSKPPSRLVSPRRLRRLDFGAFGAPRLSAPQHKFLARTMPIVYKYIIWNRDVAKRSLIGRHPVLVTYHVTRVLRWGALMWYRSVSRRRGGGSRCVVAFSLPEWGRSTSYLRVDNKMINVDSGYVLVCF